MSIGALSNILSKFSTPPAAINNNNDLQKYTKENSFFDNKFLKDFDIAGGNKNPDGIINKDDLTSYLASHKNPTTGIEVMQNSFAQKLLDNMNKLNDNLLHFDPNNTNGEISFSA